MLVFESCDDNYSGIAAEWSSFAAAKRKDFRNLGLILIQLCIKRKLSKFEVEKFSNLDLFTTEHLVESVIDYYRYPLSLRKLFEICFHKQKPDDVSVSKHHGVKTMQVNTSYDYELRKLYFNMKDYVQHIYHDYPPPPKQPPFW